MVKLSEGKGKISRFWLETKRIFSVSKKPTKKEFNLTVKICLVGVIIIGGISYIIQAIASAIEKAPVKGTGT